MSKPREKKRKRETKAIKSVTIVMHICGEELATSCHQSLHRGPCGRRENTRGTFFFNSPTAKFNVFVLFAPRAKREKVFHLNE